MGLKAFVADEGHASSPGKTGPSSKAPGQWLDPGQYAFPMYTQLQACVIRAAKTPVGVERMLVRLRAKAESMGNKMAPPEALGGNGEKPCSCMALGTMCVDCIVKSTKPKNSGV